MKRLCLVLTMRIIAPLAAAGILLLAIPPVQAEACTVQGMGFACPPGSEASLDASFFSPWYGINTLECHSFDEAGKARCWATRWDQEWTLASVGADSRDDFCRGSALPLLCSDASVSYDFWNVYWLPVSCYSYGVGWFNAFCDAPFGEFGFATDWPVLGPEAGCAFWDTAVLCYGSFGGAYLQPPKPCTVVPLAPCGAVGGTLAPHDELCNRWQDCPSPFLTIGYPSQVIDCALFLASCPALECSSAPDVGCRWGWFAGGL